MIKKTGKCLNCGCFCNIANKKYSLCFRCNAIRLHKQKSAVKQEDKKGYKSEVDMYHEIWRARPPKCEISDQDLSWTFGTDIWYSCFAHLYPKSKFPQWKYLPVNVMLMHPDYHHCYDYGTMEQKKELFGEQGLSKINKRKKKVLESK